MKTLRIQAHCNDCFHLDIEHRGEEREYDGYVPSFFGSGSDDIRLEIDVRTGMIIGWKPPTDEDLDELFDIQEEE